MSNETPKPRPPQIPLTATKASHTRGIHSGHNPVSRCTVPGVEELTWVFYRGNDGSIKDEILSHTAPLGQIDQELAIALISETIDAAALGNLEDGTDILPISIDPEIWEIRFRFGGGLYRLYYGEPFDHPKHLVALRFHKKLILPIDQEINDAQDGEIARAAVRYVSGRSDFWGNLEK